LANKEAHEKALFSLKALGTVRPLSKAYWALKLREQKGN
jgi:hypothetical protein